ncbi:MAG: signal peptidase II [Oscillospiraceae bacterium]|nr:signal peptidase II [Oscillospiraceae bacterium]
MINSIIFTAVLIIIDRISKIMAAKYLVGKGTVVIIPNLLGLQYLENTGMAFSMLSGKTIFLAVVTSLALAVMAYFLFVKRIGQPFERFCFILIFAGGVGNLIDRIFQGYVIDYFEFLFMDLPSSMWQMYMCVLVLVYMHFMFFTQNTLKRKNYSGIYNIDS